MRIEFVAYSAGRLGVDLAVIREGLPKNLREGLMRPPQDIAFHFFVNEKDEALVRSFDEYLKVGRRGDVIKERRAEVDENDIDAYSFYRISPDPIDLEHGFYAGHRLPQCEERPWPQREGIACPTGAAISGPYFVSERKIGKKRQIASVGYPNRHTVDLLLRHDLYEVFKVQGVTGLDYEPCSLRGDSVDRSRPFGVLAHVVDGGGAFRASSVDSKRVCKLHRTLFAGAADQILCEGELRDLDFQVVRRVLVGKEEYHQWPPHWFVSKRVVKLLVSNHVVGLRRQALFLDEPFIPVLPVVPVLPEKSVRGKPEDE